VIEENPELLVRMDYYLGARLLDDLPVELQNVGGRFDRRFDLRFDWGLTAGKGRPPVGTGEWSDDEAKHSRSFAGLLRQRLPARAVLALLAPFISRPPAQTGLPQTNPSCTFPPPSLQMFLPPGDTGLGWLYRYYSPKKGS
jgi:hypothetical protein